MVTTYETLTESQIKNYFKRLGLSWEEKTEPSLALLNQLIEAHQKSVPFESLDVYWNKLPISLKIEDLYHKIVEKNRGGYCFEINTLFVCLLRSLGYDAWSCFCRVVRGMDLHRAVTHGANIVSLEGKTYFCDVGFGGPMPCQAVLLESGRHQMIGGEEYWPLQEEHGWWALMRMRKGSQDDYDSGTLCGEQLEILFHEGLVDPMDYLPLNAYVSEREESIFRQRMRVNLRTDCGYKDIGDMVFTVKENGIVTRKTMESEEERLAVLKEHFGLDLKEE